MLVVLLFTEAEGTNAQVDSSFSVTRNPNAALRRSIIPGWGQWYNRQYLKVPVVYAGFITISGGIAYTNRRYNLYRHAYLYTARLDPGGEPVFPEYAAEYTRLLAELNLPEENTLSDSEILSQRRRLEPHFKKNRELFRRNRDLLVIGVGIWYGLTIIDAFVSAHLFDFDVGADLTARLRVGPGLAGFTATVLIE